MSNVLELSHIRKSFGAELVIDDLSLVVPEHSATVLIGASGSGKSTLLRCINLLETIDDGEIFLDGQEISDPKINVDEVRRKLGMVFQSFNLFPHKTVLENITLSPIKVHGKSRDEAIEQALQLLNRFGLADKADQYPDRLSGGQQQRVAIIRSLAVNPRLLLLDEVTSALDPVLVNEVLSAVRELKSDGMTMVLATHEMGFATQVADEVCPGRGRSPSLAIAPQALPPQDLREGHPGPPRGVVPEAHPGVGRGGEGGHGVGGESDPPGIEVWLDAQNAEDCGACRNAARGHQGHDHDAARREPGVRPVETEDIFMDGQ